MKIMFVINSLLGEGAQRVVVTLAEQMARCNVRVHLCLLCRRKDYHVHPDIAVHYLSRLEHAKSMIGKILCMPVLAVRLKRLVARLESEAPFDMIISNLPFADYITYLSGVKRAVFCIHQVATRNLRRALLFRGMERFLVKTVYRNRKLIAVSNAVKNDLVENFGLNHANIEVIYNPFCVNDIRDKAQLTVPEIPDQRYIIGVGSFTSRKRFDILLRACAKISADHKLVILGDGPLKDRMRKLAGTLGIDGRVVFAGWRRNPYPWIRNADLLVLTSDYESFGMVVVEALICDTPVVSTRCFGPEEIMTGSLAKYLVPVGDVEAVAGKIDEALNTAISIDGAVVERFSAEKIVGDYLNVAKGRDF